MLWFLKIELLSEIFYSKIFSVFHFKGAGGFRMVSPFVHKKYTKFYLENQNFYLYLHNTINRFLFV